MMLLDDLKLGWQSEIITQESKVDLTSAFKLLEKETDKIDKFVRRQDLIEISTAILCLPFIIYFLLYSNNLIQSIGFSIWIFVCLFTPYKLLMAKKIKINKSTNMKMFLQLEREKLIKQIDLLDTFLWWHLIPALLGIILVSAGATVDESGTPQIGLSLFFYYALCVVLTIGVYFYNQRTASKKLHPLLDKINQQLDQMK